VKTQVDEIAPELFRISTYIPQAALQFNQFLVRDDEPLLFHTGMRGMFSLVRKAVERLLDPARIRWIGFSHFEADECGSLNEWLALAPQALPVCGIVGATVNINDFADRRARVLADGEILVTGRRRFRHLDTPQVPHGWDAGLLFEETEKTLFCSDLFLQSGRVEPLTRDDVLDRARQALLDYEAGPLPGSFPFTRQTEGTLRRLADLEPKLLATMHGSSFADDGAHALLDLAVVLAEVMGKVS